MTKEEALEKVNQASFPAAQEGDDVLFEGYWFLHVNGQWILDESKTVS
jgi:hypothetical protein